MNKLSILALLAAWLPFQGGQSTVIRHGANLPAVCTANQEVFVRDTVGIYWCSAANTWTVIDAAIVGTSGQIIVTSGSGTRTLSLASPLIVPGDMDLTGRLKKFNNAAPADGQLLVGSTANARFDLATLTGTTNQVAVTNGSSSITLATPQNIHTGASPQFAALGLGTAAGGTTGGLRLSSKIEVYNNAAPTNGQLLIGNTGTGVFDAAGLTAGTAINIANGAGAITVSNTGVTSATGTGDQVNVSAAIGAVTFSLPQSIATSSSPTFNGLTVTSLTFNGQTVSKAANDSCGAGFACLRVPN